MPRHAPSDARNAAESLQKAAGAAENKAWIPDGPPPVQQPWPGASP